MGWDGLDSKVFPCVRIVLFERWIALRNKKGDMILRLMTLCWFSWFGPGFVFVCGTWSFFSC